MHGWFSSPHELNKRNLSRYIAKHVRFQHSGLRLALPIINQIERESSAQRQQGTAENELRGRFIPVNSRVLQLEGGQAELLTKARHAADMFSTHTHTRTNTHT